jgi:hypothetical protein
MEDRRWNKNGSGAVGNTNVEETAGNKRAGETVETKKAKETLLETRAQGRHCWKREDKEKLFQTTVRERLRGNRGDR